MSLICKASLTATTFVPILLLSSGVTFAQSGRGLMHGYVAFEDVSYNDLAEGKLHATIELRALGEGNESVYTTKTDERGSYDLSPISMGEYELRISAPGYASYETRIYIPSDFECRLAIMMKRG
jgi:hypothetical protein